MTTTRTTHLRYINATNNTYVLALSYSEFKVEADQMEIGGKTYLSVGVNNYGKKEGIAELRIYQGENEEGTRLYTNTLRLDAGSTSFDVFELSEEILGNGKTFYVEIINSVEEKNDFDNDVDVTIYEKIDDIPEIVKGDINGDGEIDSLDAVMALKYDAGIIDLDDDQMLSADVNGDGEVDSFDAVLILKYDAGIIDEL